MTDLPPRITLRRVKGGRMPEGTRVVTRATIFGNPWVSGNPGQIYVGNMGGFTLPLPMDAQTAVNAYRHWLKGDREWWMRPNALSMSEYGWASFWKQLEDKRAEIRFSLPELRGRPLACFCKPGEPCHADVLIELANRGEA